MGAPTVNTQLRFPYPTLIEGVFSDRLRLISEGYRAPFGSIGRALNPDDAVPLDQVQELIAAAVSAIGPSAPIEIGWTQIFSMVSSGNLIDGATYVIKDCPTTDKASLGFPEIYFRAYKVYATNPINSDPYMIIPGPNVVMRHENFTDSLIYGEVDWKLNTGGGENPAIKRVVDLYGNDISGENNIQNFKFNDVQVTNNLCDGVSTVVLSPDPGFGAVRNNVIRSGGVFDFDGSVFVSVENNVVQSRGRIIGTGNAAGDTCSRNVVSALGRLVLDQSLFENSDNMISFMEVQVDAFGSLNKCTMTDPNVTTTVLIAFPAEGKTCTAFYSDFEGSVYLQTDLTGTNLSIPSSQIHCGLIIITGVPSGATISNIQFSDSMTTRRRIRFRIDVNEIKTVDFVSVAENSASYADLCFPVAGAYTLTVGGVNVNKTLEIEQLLDYGGIWQLLHVIDFA